MSRVERTCWIIGAIGLLAAAIGWAVEPRDFAYAWLAALSFWLGLPLGGMALVLVHALTGGRWGEAARPGLLLGVLSLGLLLPALVPLLLTAPLLYPWLHTSELANHFYLNVPFFAGRGVFYLIVWFGVAALVLRGGALMRIAPPALILLAFTVTFASIDTVLSLDPSFRSSAFGMIIAASMGLLALCFALLLAAFTAPDDALADLGKLLLGLVVLWAYLEFMQLLIVWNSNLVSDAPWYAKRMHGGWGDVLGVLAICHFALPFFLLIFPPVQRSRLAMAAIALLLIAMEVLRCWWLVLPEGGRSVGWLDIGCMLAFGGLALGIALRAAASPLGRKLRHV